MILFDPIIFSLQKNGGVSIYFNNLISRASALGCDYKICENHGRLLERYRDCIVSERKGVFHSSYYRLPSQRHHAIVTTVHDFTYEKFNKGPAQWVHTWQKNRAIKNSDIIICVSQNTANDLMEFCKVDESQVRIVHNGVSDVYRQLSHDSSVKQYKNIVLFVGARGGYKNFSLAVEAVSRVPNLDLHIVGGGELTPNEKQLLNQFLPQRFKWLGWLDNEELNEAYNKAYALIYPSSYEGFGIPIIEAMRAGCPVVAVNTSSIPEVAGNAAILVETPLVSSFVEALESIIANRDQIVNAGLHQAAKFSWQRCFEETNAVYKELI